MRTGNITPPFGTPLNTSHALALGLVGCFLLNEGGGQIAWDKSPKANSTGALTNGAVYTTKQLGKCLGVDGVNDFVNLGTRSRFNLSGNMTVSCWFNTNSVSAGAKQLVCDCDNPGNTLQWNIGINQSAGKLYTLPNAGAPRVEGATALSTGKWYQAAMTRKGGTGSWDFYLYLNGVQEASSLANANNPQAQQGAAIGALGANAGFHFFGGSIKNVMIYDRALTAQEMMQLYKFPYCMFTRKY